MRRMSRNGQIHRYLIQVIYLLLFLISSQRVNAFEPITALDDRFAVPGSGSLMESTAQFPGIEPFIAKPFALLAWQEPYGIEELAVTTVHAGTGIGRLGVSVGFSGSGFDLYGDELLKAGLSYAVLNNLSIGARVARTAIRIKGFGDASAFSFDIGAVYHPIETLWIAFSAENITGTELGKSHEPIDGAVRLSTSWQFIDRVRLIADIRDTPRYEPSLGAGFSVHAAGPLTIGAIAGTEPDHIELLAGLSFSGLRFAWRGSYHHDLGMSHCCSLAWGE